MCKVIQQAALDSDWSSAWADEVWASQLRALGRVRCMLAWCVLQAQSSGRVCISTAKLEIRFIYILSFSDQPREINAFWD